MSNTLAQTLFYIDKLDAAIAPHPQLGAYSSELDMFDTRLEKRLQDILKAAGRNVGDKGFVETITVNRDLITSLSAIVLVGLR